MIACHNKDVFPQVVWGIGVVFEIVTIGTWNHYCLRSVGWLGRKGNSNSTKQRNGAKLNRRMKRGRLVGSSKNEKISCRFLALSQSHSPSSALKPKNQKGLSIRSLELRIVSH
ncbi:hypothetical protein SCA6_007495 [Theobroma cacao]